MNAEWRGETELVQQSKINVVLQQQQQLAVTSSVVLPLKTKHLPIIIAKVDSAARSHYWLHAPDLWWHAPCVQQ